MQSNFGNIPSAPSWLLGKLEANKKNPAPVPQSSFRFMAPGARNSTMTSIAGFLKRRHSLSEDDSFEIMKLINLTADDPLDDVELKSIARSISKKVDPIKCPSNEIELSRAVAEQLAPSHRSTAETGWKVFYDGYWTADTKEVKTRERIKCILEKFHQVALARADMEAVKITSRYQNSSKVNAILDLVRVNSALSTLKSDFDADPDLLNLANGTLSLNAGTLTPHDPKQLLTKKSNIHFDQAAICPHFDRLLCDSLSEEHRAFLLRLFGYALLGKPKEQIFVILYGHGANGKSTLMNAVLNVFGDYAASAEPSTFIKTATSGPRPDIAVLKGARMVSTSELATGERLNSALMKRTTGGDVITARFLYSQDFSFVPQFVPFMVTNALPVIDGADQALQRRIVLLHFQNTVPAERRDKDLAQKLAAEAPGILNRILEGARDYKKIGLAIPEDLQSAAASYANSSDMIAAFLEDECVLDQGGQAAASDVYFRYKLWAGMSGLRPLSLPIFKIELQKKLGVGTKKTNKGAFWPGLLLRQLQ